MDISGKHVFIDALAFAAAYAVSIIAPYLFYAVWVFLILGSRFLVSKETRSTSRFIFVILIGAPIGVLAAAAAHEHGLEKNIAALAGCGIAIMAEQILNAEIPRKILDAIIQKWIK